MTKSTIVNTANLHLISSNEAKLIADLRGKSLKEIYTDSFNTALVMDSTKLYCIPDSGVGRSPADDYEELVRLSFALLSDKEYDKWFGHEAIQKHLFNKTIENIYILSSLILFTPPVEVGPTDILGVELPAGREYSVYTIRPFTPEGDTAVELLSDEKLVNQVDIGIQIIFEDKTAIAITTDGYRFFTFVYWTTEEARGLELTSLPISLETRIDLI